MHVIWRHRMSKALNILQSPSYDVPKFCNMLDIARRNNYIFVSNALNFEDMIHFLKTTDRKYLTGVALLRLDFNTEDDWRLRFSLPTIKFLLQAAKAVVIISHKGRPKGVEPTLSLKKDGKLLEQLLKREVHFIPHFRFEEIKREVCAAPRSSLFLLENIRFLKGEMTPQPELAKQLASLADYYVNDAFAVSHRTEDSVTGVAAFLPRYAGLELAKEMEVLGGIRVKPQKPFIVILGGGKAEDKLGVIEAFREKADAFLLGGAAANTFLFLRGVNVGYSKRDQNPESLEKLKKLIRMKKIIMPVDWKEKNGMILDIGPKTVEVFKKYIARAKIIFWSGPMGYIEEKEFEKGNLAIAKAIVANKKAETITGGGETIMFLKKYKLDTKFSFISTGGGAMLEFLAGKKLPGIEALRQ